MVVFILYNYVFWNNLSQKTKFRLLRSIRRKPLPIAMNDLYKCIVEEVDQPLVERNAKERLQKHFDYAFTGAGFVDGVELVLVGSVAEKFSLPYHPGFLEFRHGIISDYDFMMSGRMESASFNSSEDVKYRVVSDDPNLCKSFVYIFANGDKLSSKSVRTNIQNIVLNTNKRFLVNNNTSVPCLNSISICTLASKSFCQPHNVVVETNGPAITISTNTFSSYGQYFDITFSVHCIDWPSSISDWQHRRRNWPKNEEVEKILSFGCHLVPKSPENGDEMAWRLSFSRNEVELSKLIPPVARMCFITIKAIRKNDFTFSKIPSYLLKSILFYTLEKTEPTQWLSRDDENLSKCFHLLLDNIIKAFESKSCPHFWIPDINLLSDEAIEEYEKSHRKDTPPVMKMFNCYILDDEKDLEAVYVYCCYLCIS